MPFLYSVQSYLKSMTTSLLLWGSSFLEVRSIGSHHWWEKREIIPSSGQRRGVELGILPSRALLCSCFSCNPTFSRIAAALEELSHTWGCEPQHLQEQPAELLGTRVLELLKRKTLFFKSSCAFKCEAGAGRQLALNWAQGWERGWGHGATAITARGARSDALRGAWHSTETAVGVIWEFLRPPPAHREAERQQNVRLSLEMGLLQSNSSITGHLLGSAVSLASSGLSPEVLSLSLGWVGFSIYLQVRFYLVQATDISQPRHLPGNKEHC